MYVSTIQHKGKKVVFIDYSHCKTPEDTIVVLNELRDVFLASNEGFLTLSNFTNAPVSNEFSALAKQYGKEVLDKKTIKSACFGIVGLQRILLNGYNIFVKNKIVLFDTKEEGLEYLVK